MTALVRCNCGHYVALHVDPGGCCVGTCECMWGDTGAPELSTQEAGTVARFSLRSYAPESLRERLAAAFADEDQAALHGPALGWPETQRAMSDGGAYYRRLADTAIRIVTESALR